MKTYIIKLIAFSTILKICHSIDNDSKQSKNVIIIVADDLGFHDVSYRGSNEIPTYNIDALAYNGIILDRFYTSPMCTPSRSALMTGKYSHHMGMQDYVIVSDEPFGVPLEEKLISEYFKDAGYTTHLVGKWHLGFFKEVYTPTHRGFDHFFGFLGPYIDYFDYTLKMFTRNYSRGYDLRRNLEVDRSYENVYVTDLLTQETIEIIENHDGEKPLFLLLNHLAPHSANDDVPLQAKDEDIEKFSYIDDENRRTLAAMVHSLDESVGEVFDALHRKNMLNDSIIVFLSDNGGPTTYLHATTASNYPFRGQKQTSWEGGIRTDAIIYGSSLPSGVIRNEIFHITDIIPTILSLADSGVKVERKIDGIDLSQMIKNNKPPYRDEIVTVENVAGYSSYIYKYFKLVNGSSSMGETDGFLGSNNNSEINISGYIDGVLNSKVAKILEFYHMPLNSDAITKLRDESTVKCAGVHIPCDLLQEPCLFDLRNDPCEEKNLAPSNRLLIDAMIDIFYDQLKNLVPSIRKPRDARCDPVNFNFTWTWWE